MLKPLRVASVVPLLAVLVFAAGGCASSPRADSQNAREDTVQELDATASYVPDGDAAANEPYFQLIASQYSASETEFSGEQLVNTFTGAGFDREHMQVTFDKTPLGYDADSLFLSVRFGNECLIAQFARSDRSNQTERAAALGPDKSVCIIGGTREINW